MDLPTITALLPQRAQADLAGWRPGDGWLAGGTWLFSEPQDHLTRLRDLTTMAWPPVIIDAGGATIAATCTISELSETKFPANWLAAILVRQCCDSFLASFKVWHTATVGGNICAALPAGPMISLTASLDARYEIWSGTEVRHLPAGEFVSAPQQTALEAGEILRGIRLDAQVLARRTAFRQFSLTPLGRSAALLVGVLGAAGSIALTVTASTPRPVRIALEPGSGRRAILQALDSAIGDAYYDDVHGDPLWRRHLTERFAVEIVDELRAPQPMRAASGP